MNEVHINEMTKKDFMKLPYRKWNEDVGIFTSIVIIPGTAKRLHDSGYRIMDFAFVKLGKAFCLVSGCTDVLCIEGISGMGKFVVSSKKDPGHYAGAESTGWSIDCLPKSGLLHLFPKTGQMEAGLSLSSFEIFSCSRKEPR